MNGYRSITMTAALCFALSGAAWAQGTTSGTTGTTGQTGTMGTSGAGQAGTTGTASGTTGTTGTTTTGQEPALAPDTDESMAYNNEWIASGFVGGNFGQNSLSSSVDFGGTLAYLYRGVVGAEFLAGFSPRFNFDRLVTGSADVNNYMANAIVAIPVGTLGSFRPFISGGVGAVTMSLNTNAVYSFGPGGVNAFTSAGSNNSVFDPNASHFAADIGGGVMAFAGRWGVRGDIRYFSAVGTSNSTTVINAAGQPVNSGNLSATTFKDSALLNDVKFWRANIGVAFRW
jgi:hypothetical protein